ncbi:MAG: CoA pyrophosphatase [Balneolaceae bacterium]
MINSSFYSYLKNRLEKPLPGQEAHLQMAPAPVDGATAFRMEADEQASASSVMVLLFENECGIYELILTLRTDSISHGGQISFPGGRSDANESAVQTALREMEEEIGIGKKGVQVAGTLSQLFLERSNNLITPVMGYLPSKPDMKINPLEVEEVFCVPLEVLNSNKNLVKKPWNLREQTYEVPYWNIHSVPLWGATAMIISELMELYKEFSLNSENRTKS